MLHRRALGMLAAIVLALVGPTQAAWAGDATPKVRHRDAKWKFSVLMFDQYKPVPLAPAADDAPLVERKIVARFFEKDELNLGSYVLPDGNRGVAEIYVLGPSDEGKVESLLVEGAKNRGIRVSTGGKPVKTKDGVPGTAWIDSLGAKGDHWHVASAVWRKDGVQLGLWMAAYFGSAGTPMGFDRVVNSVVWSDERAAQPAAKGPSPLDGLQLTPERRREIERGLVKGWDLIVSPGKQYVVVYNTKGGKNNRLAQVIAARIETIRKQLYEPLFPPATPIDATSVVRVCADEGEYHAYGGPQGSGGYWCARDEELVFFDMSESRAPDDDTLSVLYHEAFHQYVFYAAGSVAPHSWFNEGHGDYFGGAVFKDGKFRIQPNGWRVGVIGNALAPTSPTRPAPLRELVKMSREGYYEPDRIGLNYAAGWSLVYFLRAIVPTKPEWDAKWGKILDTYFRVLREETARRAKGKDAAKAEPQAPPVPPKPPKDGATGAPVPAAPETGVQDKGALEVALEAAFVGVDFAELEAAWRDAVGALIARGRRR